LEFKAKIKLRLATKKDFLELKGYKPEGGAIYALRKGVPYWLLSSKGKLENKNYVTTEATDAKQIGDFIMREQIFIPK
jgi:hypothetical protein